MSELICDLLEAFSGGPNVPGMSLRAGDACDDGDTQPPFDPAIDQLTPEYFEQYFWGLSYLDPASWRYYLPHLLRHALDSFATPSLNAVDAVLASLRPPDRDPPRFGSLTAAQERVVARALEELAFNPQSLWQEDAIIALEEYWAPGATYR
jgi:hypothetical protein